MGLTFYKPNSSNKGHGCSFSFNSKDQSIYVDFVKQMTWNPNTKIGTFKDGVSCTIKLNMSEVGSMIDVIERSTVPDSNLFRLISSEKDDGLGGVETVMTKQLVSTASAKLSEFSNYHGGEGKSNQTVQIKFAPYFSGEAYKGLSLSVVKSDPQDSTSKVSFVMGFTIGEAITLREYLKFALTHCFSAIYSVDKKNFEEYQKRLLEQEEKESAPNSTKERADEDDIF